MDDEPIRRESVAMILNLVGLAACAVAILSSGGLAFLGGAVAVLCLAGSVAASVSPGGTEGERYFGECDDAPTPDTTDEPAISQEAGQCHRWRQTVATSRRHCRGR